MDVRNYTNPKSGVVTQYVTATQILTGDVWKLVSPEIDLMPLASDPRSGAIKIVDLDLEVSSKVNRLTLQGGQGRDSMDCTLVRLNSQPKPRPEFSQIPAQKG